MSTVNTTSGIAILSIGLSKLVFPQSDIVSVDVVADAKPSGTDDRKIVAVLNREDGQWPVYSLSEKLIPQYKLLGSSRFCVCIKRNDIYYALACDAVDVSQLDINTLKEDIPTLMETDYSPALSLMRVKQDIALVVDALSINRYLAYLDARNV